MAGKGGRRPGAGRKPKRIDPATKSPIRVADLTLAKNLPKLVDVAVALGLAGDKTMLMFCIERVMGKAVQPVELDVKRTADRLASAVGADAEFLIRRAQQLAAENAEATAQ